jgi:hypothetical protein
MALSYIFTVLGTVLSFTGGLIVIVIPGKRDPSKETSLADRIAPFLIKDSTLTTQQIYNDLYGDDLERRRTIKRNIGIICFVVGNLLLLASLVLFVKPTCM